MQEYLFLESPRLDSQQHRPRGPARAARLLRWALLVVAGTVPAVAQGQGYFGGTKGARAAGRAGAFTARADDLSAVQLNPAGLAHLQGTLLHAGNRFSHNAHRFKRQATLFRGEDVPDDMSPLVAFPEVRNGQPWQLLDPLAGAASDLGLQDFHFALAVYAPAGVGQQEFPEDGGQRYMMVSRDAQIINYTASVAWAESDVFGVGASLVWVAVPKLDYEMVIDGNTFPDNAYPVESPFDMLANISGSDLFTFNLILGAFYRPVPFLEIGVSGQVIPSELKADSTLDVDWVSPDIDDPVGLERNGQPANDVSLTLPLPITARAGIRYIHLQGARELFDIEFDVAYASWSSVRRFTLDTGGLAANYRSQRVPLGVVQIEKHWRDTLGVQLGGDYALFPDRLVLRGGLFYESAVARPAYANVDFVGGQQLGGAVGASLFLGDFELAVAYELRHAPPVRVAEQDARVYQVAPGSACVAPYTDESSCHDAYLGQPAPAVNAGTYSADSSGVSLDLLYRF